MKSTRNNITKVKITEKNSGIVDFIRKEIAAKKEVHENIVKSIDKATIERLKALGKIEFSK